MTATNDKSFMKALDSAIMKTFEPVSTSNHTIPEVSLADLLNGWADLLPKVDPDGDWGFVIDPSLELTFMMPPAMQFDPSVSGPALSNLLTSIPYYVDPACGPHVFFVIPNRLSELFQRHLFSGIKPLAALRLAAAGVPAHDPSSSQPERKFTMPHNDAIPEPPVSLTYLSTLPKQKPGQGRIICLDFDGVIHSYTSGFLGIDQIPDAPVEGAFDFINSLLDQEYKVAIYSSRSSQLEGITAMSRWFREQGFTRLGELAFPGQKPAAYLTIDDRAIQFTGIFPSLQEIQDFKPWNKK